MNELEEKFWDTAITEAAAGKRPPDQAARILARLNTDAAPVAKARRRWVRYPLEIAAAAALVVAIGFATGLLQWPGEDATPPEVVVDRKWVAGPDSMVVETENGLRLERGWVLLQPGAPDVQCGESALSKIDGLVLAHAGAAPTEKQVAAAQDWLRNNQVEADMLNAKKWAAGLAMAVLVFNGSTILDGQEVDAEPKPAPAEPVWHKVDSAMAIDRLPKDARYVEAFGLEGDYLKLILEVPGLRGVRFRSGHGLANEHLSAVKGQQELEVLELARARWLGLPNYSCLLELPNLKRAALEIVQPSSNQDPGSAIERQLKPVIELIARGTEVDFGSISGKDLLLLHKLATTVKPIRRLTVEYGSEDTLRILGEFPDLMQLHIRATRSDELGFLQLARSTSVGRLEVSHANGMKELYVHQISKIKTLRSLTVGAPARDEAKSIIEVLGQMGQLAELELSSDYWFHLRSNEFASSGGWKREKPLERLALPVRMGSEVVLHPVHIPFFIPTKTLELEVQDWGELSFKAVLPDKANVETAKALNRLVCRVYEFAEHADVSEFVTAAKLLPSLRTIELVRWDEVDEKWNPEQVAVKLREALPDIEIVVRK